MSTTQENTGLDVFASVIRAIRKEFHKMHRRLNKKVKEAACSDRRTIFFFTKEKIPQWRYLSNKKAWRPEALTFQSQQAMYDLNLDESTSLQQSNHLGRKERV
jgi:hypothetical protein